MSREQDTIVALATGQLPSALAVIRMSGARVMAIVEAVTRRSAPQPRRAVVRRLVDLQGRDIDEAVVVVMPGPASFTGEDCAELTLHGGPAVVAHCLETVTALPGVRLAEPGEFTRRAFEAGKLDLTQAEAIADIIAAETPLQKDAALRQLGGTISSAYQDWRLDLVEILALIEVMVDFTDESDAPDDTTTEVAARIEDLVFRISRTLDDDRAGERVRDGIRIAILGAPNAGKSTLLNRLVGRDAAIVTPIAGTTRDVIDVRLVLAGVPVTLSDTAGLRATDDVIEAEGVERARRAAQAADLRIHLMTPDSDYRVQPGPNDVVVNSKIDAVPCVDPALPGISARTGEGIDAFLATLEDRIKALIAGQESAVVTRARHRDSMSTARQALENAAERLLAGHDIAIVAEDVRQACQALDRLVGRLDVEAVLGAVFSRFCIGK